MTNNKKTKRALLASALSLLVCISMLIGSTFAWFTDSVTSTVNTIQSGTLDVDLVDAQDNSLEGKILKFVDKDNNDLWEPGCTYKLEDVYVVNKGNLALKYEIVINGINGDEKLLEAIEWTVTVDGETKNLDELNGYLLPEEKSKAIVLSGHMKEEASNEYQNLSVDGIAISVFATQYTYEYDSIGNEYDKIALVSSADDLKDAIEAGMNIMLTNDVELEVNGKAMKIADDKKVIVDLNGNDIIATTTASDASQVLFEVKGELTVIGEGTIALYDKSGASFNESYENATIFVNGGIANLNEGMIVCTSDGNAMAYAADAVGGNSVINVNGATLYSSYIGIRSFPTVTGKTNTINYNSGVVYGAKNGYDIWTQEGNGSSVVNIADDIVHIYEDDFGGMYYIEDDATIVSTSEGLATAIEAGGNIVLATDVLYENTKLEIPKGKEVDLDLNGNTLAGVNTQKGTSALLVNKGNLNIMGNGTITVLAENPDTDWDPEGFPTYASNTISNSGNLTINEGVKIENQTVGGGASYAIDNYAGATLTINGGEIIQSGGDVAIRMNTASATLENKVVINGGKISGRRAIWIHLAGSNSTVAPTVNLEINGGNLTGTQMCIYSYSYGNSFVNTKINISGGTFNGDVQFGGGYKGDQETVSVTGGTFNARLGRWLEGDGWEDIAIS